MVIITSKGGEKFEVSIEMANKFIKAWDIDWYETVDGEFVEWEVEPTIEQPVKRKNVVRKIKPNQK